MEQVFGFLSALIHVIGNVMIAAMVTCVILFIFMGIMMSGSGREYLDDKEDEL